MTPEFRQEIQDLFIRICRDSGFKMGYIQAAAFTAEILKVSPLEIWVAFGDLSIMERIADNDHPTIGA